MCVLSKPAYLAALRVAAASAAEPAFVAESPMYDSAKGQKHYYCLSHQHKAAGMKTRLGIQNYGCNGNLLCDHGVVERNRISSFAEPWKDVGQN